MLYYVFVETASMFLKTGFAVITSHSCQRHISKGFLKITDKQGKNTAQTDAELQLPTVHLAGSANAISNTSLKRFLEKPWETSRHSSELWCQQIYLV